MYWTPEIGHVFPAMTPGTMGELRISQFFGMLLALERRRNEST